uniref:Variant surface glycoprotein 1363 n=1 Tax=Trypanosoma brucei TaxID=5691 RepID=M4TBG6_9TRYP|nr:variant surface glycoprotein 1363 [Trypanosoma brucei]
MRQPTLLFLLTIAAGSIPTKTLSAANDQLHQDTVAQLCGFSLKPQKAAARVEKKLSNIKNRISSLVLTSKRLQTFGVKNPQWAEAAFILELHFDKLRDATLGDLATKLGGAVKLSSQSAYAEGRIDETTSMFVRARHSTALTTALCVSNSVANTPMEEGKDSDYGATDVTKESADDTDLATAAAVFRKETTIKGSTATSCKLTQGVSNAFGADGGDFELVGGLITLASAGGFKSNSYAKTAAEVPFLQPLTKSGTETHSYISSADDPQTVTPASIKDMLNKASTADTLADAINDFYQYEPSKAPDELKPIVKNLFKVAAIGGEVGFAKALEGDKAAVKPKGSEELEKTMALNSEQLTREEVHALKALYQKTSKKAPYCSKELLDSSEAYKKAEETCKKLTEVSACNANPICIYNTTESEENK